MKIAIGNDHAATELKFIIMDYVKSLGHEVVNFGTDGNESCNYPEFGEKVGRAVVGGEADWWNPDLRYRSRNLHRSK